MPLHGYDKMRVVLVAEMTRKREVTNIKKVTPIHTYTDQDSYYHYDDNNYVQAVFDGFRQLWYKKASRDEPLKFDMALCRSLVFKYQLSCSDCQIEECENHGIDQFR